MFSRKRRDTSSVNISGYTAYPMIYRPPYGSKGFGGLGGSNGRYVPSVATSPYEQIYNQYSYGQGARPFGPVPLHASQSSASYGPASYGPPSYGPASYGTVSNAPITYAPSPYVPTYEPAYDPAPYAPVSYDPAPYAPVAYNPVSYLPSAALHYTPMLYAQASY